jgi:hypothetical protein
MYKNKTIIRGRSTSTNPSISNRLERRVGVGEQLLEVGLEPLAGLGGGLEGIRQAAVVVVAGSGGVAGAVALTTGLDPDEGVEQVVAGFGRGAPAEAGADGVAPVTPLKLACVSG